MARCARCAAHPGREYDFQFGYSTCRNCKGTGSIKDPYEDRLLLCTSGPVWPFYDGDEVRGIEISHSGPLSTYEPYEKAAESLVDLKLLTLGHFADRRKVYYLTPRGRIARWALLEEVALASSKG